MPFNLQLDLFSAIEKFVQFRKINEWIKLGWELLCSYWISFSTITGGALVAHRPMLEAIGEGLLGGAVFATVIWRRSPLTKGMALALPAEEAAEEFKANQQIIQK